jgi:hypothetical protein
VAFEEMEKLCRIRDRKSKLESFAVQEDDKKAIGEIFTRIDEARNNLMV